MVNMELQELAQKYYDYKEALEKIEDGDYSEASKITAYQYNMMKKIVRELEDMGFNLIIKNTN